MMVQFFNFIIDERKLSKNSTQKYEQIIYNVFKSVCKERKTTFNPVIDMPKTSRINDHTPRPIRDNHIELIKDVLADRDPQLFLACKFEYYCCLRPGKELGLLKIKDIDLFRGTVDVSAFRSKTKMARIVTIPAAFLTELRDMELDRLPVNWYVISHDGKPGPSYLGKNNLKQRWSAIRKEMNLPETYKLYSWKHTGNVRADDAGVSREELQTQNGHTSMKTTEIYLQHKGGNISKKVRDLWPTL
jgi:integrase